MTTIEFLETKRLVLRRPTAADGAVFIAIHSDPQTNRFNPSGAMTKVKAQAAIDSDIAHWIRHGFGYWAVSLRDDPSSVIGFGGLSQRSYGKDLRVNLGFRLSTHYWGQGLATEIASESLAAGWRLLHLQEIWASARENHLASRRVLENVGMTSAGRADDPRPGVATSIWYVCRLPSRVEQPGDSLVRN